MQETFTNEIKKLNDYLHQNPSSMLFARLADRYLAMKEIEKAIDICQSGLRHHPDYSSAYFVLAKCFFARKQYDEAERRLKRVISLEPAFLKAHKLYSDLMAEIGWTQSSHTSLRKIHEIDPLFPLKIEAQTETAPVESSAPNSLELDSIMDEYPMETLTTAHEFYEEPTLVQPLDMTLPVSPEIEDDLLNDPPSDDFEKEEARFSEILDDLFSPRMVEEARVESETRTLLERVVQAEQSTSEPSNSKSEPVLPPPVASMADRLMDRPIPDERKNQTADDPFESLKYPRVEPLPKVPKSEIKPMEWERSSGPSQPPPIIPMEDPFSNKLDGMKPFESEEKDFSSFLSALDEMGDAEEELSFDAELLQPNEELISFEQPGEAFTDFPTDEPDVPVNAKNRTEKPKEKFVTPTLGEIYAAQGQYAKAISVFELLLKKNPENEWYKTKLDYLKKKNQEERS
jgi:tetratricopeptide (TPR) repeat protein